MDQLINLNDKDLAVLKDTARFRSLSLESISLVHFGGSTYAWKRLGKLYKHGYVDRKYYYTVEKMPGGTEHTRRVAAFYYPTLKGLNAIGYTIDPRYVQPDSRKLDLHYMVSQLYSNIPGLLAKREAQGKYGLKNFMPVTCVVPSQPPVYICITGKNKSHGEANRLIKFIDIKYFSGTYIAVSHQFPGKKLLLTNSHFIPWNLAQEVIPRMVKDKDAYINDFLSYADRLFKGIQVLEKEERFIKVQTASHGIYNLAEIFTGSTRLMLLLRNPPPRTFVYCENPKHLQGFKLESGSFIFFSRKENKIYELFMEGGKTKHRLLSK